MDRSRLAHFGPFTFDRTHMVLHRDGQPVPIGGRGAALLAALVEADGSVVTRSQLIDAAWPNLTVEERNLTVQIGSLRKAMRPLPNGQDAIRTVSRVGYRLFQDARRPRPEEIGTARPLITVLPFANLSQDSDLAFFAEGMTDDLTTALSRFKSFAVVARGASFVYKDRSAALPEVAGALGVRYVLEGSVRREADRIRVSAQLVDTHTETHLWAERFEGRLGDVFDVQDRITEAVIGLVEPQITKAEMERARRKHPESLGAYDHFLRGLTLHASADVLLMDEAITHFDCAVELDPSFPQALAYAAWTHEFRQSWGGAPPPDVDDRALGLALAERALAAAGDDAMVLAIVGLVLQRLKEDSEGALALVERALALNPNGYLVLSLAGVVHAYHADHDRAIDLHQRALRLSPGSPYNVVSFSLIGAAHLEAGRPDEALSWATQATRLGSHSDITFVVLAAASAMLGREEEAQSALRHLLGRRPGLTLTMLTRRSPLPGQCWIEGLRHTGL